MEQQTWLTRIALRCCDWSERWLPDAYVFAALGVVVVGLSLTYHPPIIPAIP